MQVVHILGDDTHVKILFKFDQSKMSGIGLSALQLDPALVVKLMDE